MTPTARHRPTIAFYRKRKGLTQQVCADLVPVSLSTWQKYESGARTPDARQWLRIARILGVGNVYELMGHPVTSIELAEPTERGAVLAIRDALFGLPNATTAHPTGAALRADVVALWTQWQGNTATRFTEVGDRLPGMITRAESTVAGLDGADRRAALCATSDLYRLAWSYLRARDAHRLGMLAADRSRRAAQDADDAQSVAAATWGAAAMLSSTGDTDASFSVLRAAIGRLEPVLADAAPPLWAVFGQMHLLASVQAARLHRGEDAAALLAVAEQVAGRTGELNAYFTAFGPSNVMIHRVTVELERGRYAQAVRIGEQVDLRANPSVERRVAHLVHFAHASERAGQRGAAAVALAKAIGDSADEVRSLVLARETGRALARRKLPAYAQEMATITDTLQLAG